MIHVQVGDENLVEIIQRNTERIESLHRTGAHVENKLITVAQLDQKTGSRLLKSWHRHAGTAGNNAHFIRV